MYLGKEPLSMDAIEEVFEYFEEDQLGRVPAAAVQHVLAGTVTSHNTQLLREEVSDIFAVLGLSEDDPVDYAHLVRVMAGGHQPVAAPTDRRGSVSTRLAAMRAYLNRDQQTALTGRMAADKAAEQEVSAPPPAAASPTPSDTDSDVF